ncbi:MAG: lysine-2,3-aminomutase-like protein [Pseudomonadota bacterium]
MAKRLTTLEDLVDRQLLPGEGLADLARVATRYAVSVTEDMAQLMDGAPQTDPIAAQFLPTLNELETHRTEAADPIGDDAHSPVPGLVHRYPDRVLLKAASVCPVYCRFCFRREMVGPDRGQPLSEAALKRAVQYIAEQPEVCEVVVTGGDPLVMSSRRIAQISHLLAAVPHVQFVRWHTRVPVVAPDDVTPDRIAALRPRERNLAVYVAVHANHPREFTPAAQAALARLADSGVCLVGQTVLLRGVNDDRDVLVALMRAFVANRVKPYYLHHLDPAPGTSHFRVSLARGQELVRSLRGHVSGLCQPTYVVDIPGGGGKVNATPCDVARDEDGTVLIDRNGKRHRYEQSVGSAPTDSQKSKGE